MRCTSTHFSIFRIACVSPRHVLSLQRANQGWHSLAACSSSTSHNPAGMTPPQRGAFILFEGIDRSGKTTQCSKLVEHLQSKQINAELWRFPDRTTAIGQTIDGYLRNGAQLDDAVVHLLFAANRWEKRQAMLSALQSGRTLVVDRYSYSGLAYTLAKQLPDLDQQWCQNSEKGLPAPDLVFYMRVSPEASAARGGYGEERYEKAEFQKRVASKFDALREPSWVEIDAEQSIEAIHAQVVDATDRLLQGGALQQPVGKMYSSSSSSSSSSGCSDSLGDGVVTVQLSGSQPVGKQDAQQPSLAAGTVTEGQRPGA